MKKTVYAEGGRPLYDDDLQTIQTEAAIAATAVLAGLGYDCIVSGCTVSGAAGRYRIAPGLVYVGGELLRFMGATAVTLPASLVPGGVSVVYDERPYETGESKSCIQEEFAAVGAAGVGVPIHPAGGLTLQHVLRSAQWEIGDRKFSNMVVADYDPNTGVGIPGTPAWGWAIDATLAGRVAVGLDPNNADFDKIGKQAGESTHPLTIPEMPAHDHTGGVAQARFAYLDGKNTVDSNMDSSTNEPNLTKTAPIQSQGGSPSAIHRTRS
jgi:hypothetical protein